MKNSLSYWRKRAEAQENKIFNKNKKTVIEIKGMYKKALTEINSKINNYINEFADKNGKLSISKAKKILDKNELKEFHMGVNEYVKRASQKNITPEENLKLINSSLKHRIDKLEALKTEINIELNKLASKQIEVTKETLGNVYQEIYYDTAYKTYQMTGHGKYISSLDTKAIDKVVNEVWTNDGLGFSSRIWSERNKLATELYTRLFQGIALGQNAYDLITNLSEYSKDKTNKVQFNIARLLQTEASVIRNKATFDSYKESGVDKYQVVATLDGLTCDRCGAFDHKIYLVKDKEIGINCNPFHPMCRCTSVPYYDWLDKDSNVVISEKQLKDYEEWKKSNVVDSSKKKGYNKAKEEKTKNSSFLAGVSKGKPMTFKEANSGNVNPNVYKAKGYDINCQSCVPTFEARLRGYNVEVLPYKVGGVSEKLATFTNLIWIDPATGERPNYIEDLKRKTPKSYLEFIKSVIKPNQRYSMQFLWKGRGRSGHIINIDLAENGELRIKDNQRSTQEKSEHIGDKEVLAYLKRMKYEITLGGTKIPFPPRLLRIDNMYFNEEIAKEIMKGKVEENGK